MTHGGVVDDLIAKCRDVARHQAALLTSLVAVADATPVAEFAAFEISAALCWTRRAATVELELARDLVRRLPQVHAALRSGDIDLPRAREIRNAVVSLPDGAARKVAAAILPEAQGLTTGQLGARLAKLVIAIDPEAVKKRRAVRLRGRRVVVQPSADNCADLFGLDLPAEQAVAARERVAAIAGALKRAGDSRSMDQLCADTFLDLLLGRADPKGALARGGVELVASLETLAGLAQHPGHLNGFGPVIADIARQIAQQQRRTPWQFTVHDGKTGDVHTGSTRARPRRDPDPDPRPGRRSKPGGATGRASAHGPGRRAGNGSRGGTGLGGFNKPQRAGGGPASSGPASKARAGARSTVCRPDDALGQAGETDPPPFRPGGDSDGRAATGFGAFGDPRRRFPNAALARHVRARDRTCRAPGCRRPARRADLDHTIAYEHGGLTVAGNMGALCRYHHRARHVGGWRLEQFKPGHFRWRSPLGRSHIVRPEPP